VSGKIKDVEIRKATIEDIRVFYPDGPPRTGYFWVALYKGEVACLAGLMQTRYGCMAFSDVKPGINAPKRTIWETAKALLEHIKSLNLPMYTCCYLSHNMANKFVNRLGFNHLREYQGKELYAWPR